MLKNTKSFLLSMVSYLYSINSKSMGALFIIIFLANGIVGFLVEDTNVLNFIINSSYVLIAFIEIFILIDKINRLDTLKIIRFLEFVFAIAVTVLEFMGYNINADRFILPLIQFTILSVMIFNDSKKINNKE